MPKVLKPDEPYSGRRLDATVINITLDADAVELLYHFCPKGRKGTGKFLSRLIYEHSARMAERKRLIQAAYGEELAVS